MKLRLARVILFVVDKPAMARFYGEVLDLPRVSTPDDSEDFQCFDAGGCQLCLHGVPEEAAAQITITEPPAPRDEVPTKLAFGVDDVATRREELVARGAAMDPIRRFDGLELCDGTDPEGNRFQLSNR